MLISNQEEVSHTFQTLVSLQVLACIAVVTTCALGNPDVKPRKRSLSPIRKVKPRGLAQTRRCQMGVLVLPRGLGFGVTGSHVKVVGCVGHTASPID